MISKYGFQWLPGVMLTILSIKFHPPVISIGHGTVGTLLDSAGMLMAAPVFRGLRSSFETISKGMFADCFFEDQRVWTAGR